MRPFLIYAGFIPFFLSTIFYILDLGHTASKDQWLFIIQMYGGVILSFLAGIQWGLSFQNNGAASYKKYILPIWSNIIAIAAFISLIHQRETATLSILIFGFMLQLLADMHFARKGLYEKNYIKHRIIITVLVVTSLLLTLRHASL